MLVIEHFANGKRMVKLHKDWHPGRLGLAYIPKPRMQPPTDAMVKLQAALLRKDRK